jgi:hypothetical protein
LAATTDKKSVAYPSPQPTNVAESGVPKNPMLTTQFSVDINTAIQPAPNKIQTVIDARILNSCGISFTSFFSNFKYFAILEKTKKARP